MNTWIHRYMNTWIHRYMDTLILGYIDTWIRGYVDTWIHGKWIHGYLDTWIHGQTDTLITGFIDSRIQDIRIHCWIYCLLNIFLGGSGLSWNFKLITKPIKEGTWITNITQNTLFNLPYNKTNLELNTRTEYPLSVSTRVVGVYRDLENSLNIPHSGMVPWVPHTEKLDSSRQWIQESPGRRY